MIQCQDNNLHHPLRFQIVPDEQEHLTEDQLHSSQVDLLRSFARRTIGSLKDGKSPNAKGLLVLGKLKDIKDSEPLYEIQDITEGEGESVKKYIDLISHNIMGVFTLRDEKSSIRMQITSRFDKMDGSQPFLSWLLKRVCSVNQTQYMPAGKGKFWNFLLELLFWAKLGNARKVGLYRQYVKHEYNNLQFKGRLDLDRHIRLNYPLKDKIAYSRREICYDNPLNHLLRYAIDICDRDFGRSMASPDAAAMATAIKAETPTWSRAELNRILLNKDIIHELRHPFYAEFYEDLRILSLLLIDKLGVELYANKDISTKSRQINGVVFDGAWLWEAFLARLLPSTWLHANPEMKRHPINAIFDKKNNKEKHKLYPDFRLPREVGEKQLSSVILDAKYKQGDASSGLGIQREDLYQCLGYMLLTGATAGGVVYPPYLPGDVRDNDADEEPDNYVNCPGTKRVWRCHTFRYLGDVSSENFNKEMLQEEQNFRKYVDNLTTKAKSLLEPN